MIAKIGIITVSDRAHQGTYEDLSGPAIQAWLNDVLVNTWEASCRLVPDEQPVIESALRDLCEECSLIVTTGGTGPALRDVTPEATEAVCDRMLPGFGELMRTESLKVVPTAILFPSGCRYSREFAHHQLARQALRHRRLPQCGICGCSILPGSDWGGSAGDQSRSGDRFSSRVYNVIVKDSAPMNLEQMNEAFEFLEDWEDRYRFIMDLGKKLPAMPDSERVEANLVHGCQSTVWVSVDSEGGPDSHVTLHADSDSDLVKGLAAIVVIMLWGNNAAEIATADLESKFDQLGLHEHLSPTRSNGLHGMVRQVKSRAASLAAG